MTQMKRAQRHPASRNPIAKALRAATGGSHVAAACDTRPKATRKLVGKGSYSRTGKAGAWAKNLAYA